MQIYLTNLGKYNEGELVGKWVELPCSEVELQKHLRDIGINEVYEEYFITDYMTNYNFKISEYENLNKLNELADDLVSLDESDAEILNAIMDVNCLSIEELIKNGASHYLENAFVLEADSDQELGERYVNEVICGVENLSSDTLQTYFNYEAYGRDLGFSFSKNGYAVADK